jgi:hypothetical protein
VILFGLALLAGCAEGECAYNTDCGDGEVCLRPYFEANHGDCVPLLTECETLFQTEAPEESCDAQYACFDYTLCPTGRAGCAMNNDTPPHLTSIFWTCE